MNNVLTAIYAVVFAGLALRAFFTGHLPIKRATIRRSETPLLFYTMLSVYLFFAAVVWVCLSGNIMKVINLTL